MFKYTHTTHRGAGLSLYLELALEINTIPCGAYWQAPISALSSTFVSHVCLLLYHKVQCQEENNPACSLHPQDTKPPQFHFPIHLISCLHIEGRETVKTISRKISCLLFLKLIFQFAIINGNAQWLFSTPIMVKPVRERKFLAFGRTDSKVCNSTCWPVSVH